MYVVIWETRLAEALQHRASKVVLALGDSFLSSRKRRGTLRGHGVLSPSPIVVNLTLLTFHVGSDLMAHPAMGRESGKRSLAACPRMDCSGKLLIFATTCSPKWALFGAV